MILRNADVYNNQLNKFLEELTENDELWKSTIENGECIVEDRNITTFKVSFDSSSIGMVIVDSGEVIRQANLAFTRIVNLDFDDIIGKKFRHCFNCKNSIGKCCISNNECEVCKIRLNIKSAINSVEVLPNIEIHYSLIIDKKIHSIWYSMNFIPIIINGNRQVMIAIDDITEKKYLELSLTESSNSYLSQFDNFPALVWRVDTRLNSKYYNKKWLEFTGRTLQEELNTNWKDKIHPDDINPCRKICFEKFKESESFELEYRLRKSNGEYRWIVDRRDPIFDIEGNHIGFICVCHDITDKKVADENLNRYKVLLESVRDIILFIDTEGNILDVNNAAIKTYGYTRNEFQSMKVFDLREQDEVVYKQFEKAKKESNFFEALHKKKDGSRFSVEVSSQVTKLGGRKIILSIIRDITERKKVEQRLQEAKNDAELANKVKSEFLANMSHEIRTPINGMMGMIDLTLLTELDSEQTDNLIIAKSCANSLLTIINDILDFSKLEASKLTLGHIDFDLKSLLEDLIRVQMLRANQKGIDLYYNLSSNVPLILTGDPTRLRQVLDNLINNAIKFTKRGEVILYIKKGRLIDDSVELYFAVSDTGVGISEDEKSRLFKPFSQLESSYSRNFGGAGLGLAISKQLVEMMGGGIDVTSEKGKGSTFHFTVKFKIGVKPILNLIQPLQIIKTKKSLNILLVEDDEVNRTVLFRMLKEIGHNVEIACNGLEALHAYQEKKFDVILTDIQMPEMDGIELTKQIRDKECNDMHTPIIALTAYALHGDREHFMTLGIDDYIAKPIKMEELFLLIEKATSRLTIDEHSGNIESKKLKHGL